MAHLLIAIFFIPIIACGGKAAQPATPDRSATPVDVRPSKPPLSSGHTKLEPSAGAIGDSLSRERGYEKLSDIGRWENKYGTNRGECPFDIKRRLGLAVFVTGPRSYILPDSAVTATICLLNPSKKNRVVGDSLAYFEIKLSRTTDPHRVKRLYWKTWRVPLKDFHGREMQPEEIIPIWSKNMPAKELMKSNTDKDVHVSFDIYLNGRPTSAGWSIWILSPDHIPWVDFIGP